MHEALLSAMTDGAAALDESLELRFVNPAGRQILEGLGAQNPTDLVLCADAGEPFAAHPADPLSGAAVKRPVARVAARCLEHAEVVRAEGWVEVPAGARRYISLVASPILDSDARSEHFAPGPRDQGGSARVLLVFRDESAQRRAAVQLEMAVLEACRAVEAKANFLATMSHEIRTPMNAVIGLTGLLLESSLDERQRSHAETVRSSGEALLAIINDILDFSKLDAGQMQLENIEFSLRECVDQAVDLLRHRARDAELGLSVWIDPELPDGFRGDPGRLRQILLNLVGNAIKFTPRGRVALRVARLDDRVSFEVLDTGIGIDANALDEVFAPFAQGDPSMTRRFGGTGLGLAISKQLVSAFGGELTVDSRPQEGSKFRFAVPLQRAPTTRQPGAPVSPPAFALRRAMLVCADELARAGVSAALQYFGVEHRSYARWPSEGRAGADLVVADLLVPHDKDVDVRLGPPVAHDDGLSGLPHLEYPVAYARLRRALLRASGEALPDSGVFPVASLRPESPPRVLIVEDAVVNQLVAQELLTHIGARCDLVANGAEAVEAVKRVGYDLVLMDISMPVMDGYAAAIAIRGLGFDSLPIVAMTANAMPEDIRRCRAVGMQAHLAKPVTLEKLREVLAAYAKTGNAGRSKSCEAQIDRGDLARENGLKSALVSENQETENFRKSLTTRTRAPQG